MARIVTLAVCLFWFKPALSAPIALPNRAAHPVSAFLCDTADHAITFADRLAGGDSVEMAKARVGTADACGRYVGIATVESEVVTLKDGVAYKLTAFRFREDNRLAWRADTSFAPGGSDWTL